MTLIRWDALHCRCSVWVCALEIFSCNTYQASTCSLTYAHIHTHTHTHSHRMDPLSPTCNNLLELNYLDQFVPATRDNDGSLSVWRESNTAHPVSHDDNHPTGRKRTASQFLPAGLGGGGGGGGLASIAIHVQSWYIYMHIDKILKQLV